MENNIGWTIETLKEYFEKIFIEKDKYWHGILNEKDKALAAALIAVKEENRKTEVAAEKRFELLNELRSGVATKDQLVALEKMVDDLKTSRDKGDGRGSGMDKMWAGILVIVSALVGATISYLLK